MLLSSSIDVGEIAAKTFSNLQFWGTIIAAIFIIGMGYFFEKKRILTENWEKILVKLILYVGIPALIFKGFMVDLDLKGFEDTVILLILGILFYVATTTGTRVFFLKKGKSVQDTISMTVVFGSSIYFGLPIAKALYVGQDAALDNLNQAANMFNVAYWGSMCSYAVQVIKRKTPGVGVDNSRLDAIVDHNEVKKLNKFTWKDFRSLMLNPIIISMIIGLTLYLMQLIPGIKIIKVTGDGWNSIILPQEITEAKYSVTRLDALIPGFGPIMNILAGVATPLAWMAVGAMMAKGNLKDALKSKLVWYSVCLKMFFIPASAMGLLALFAGVDHAAGWDAYDITGPAFVTIVLMAASPTTSTICGYAILYDKEPKLASQVCGVATISAAITMPFWAIIASIIAATPIFSTIAN